MTTTEESKSEEPPYTMRIERTIVDKLGLHMYDKASAVVAELIANAYDADAEDVFVKLPLGKALATKVEGKIEQKGYVIEVIDDGHGMTPEEANDFYLRVGIDRRKHSGQGNTSRDKGRKVMGRKGIGKLAPFGICRTIEVRSAGGEETSEGYKITHFELDYDEITKETEGKDRNYHPPPLVDDGTWDEKSGTRIILRNFNVKIVPNLETFHRQIAIRFGLEKPDFRIHIHDTKEENPEPEVQVGYYDIPLMEGTRITLDDSPVQTDEGEEYPVTGWMGMAKQPYKHEELAGVRIYARGKIVAITRDFEIPSGFMGEFVARSYLVGEIYADWLDDEDDLIQTHRQDILWSSDLGMTLARWGQALMKEVAKRGREPRRQKVKHEFMEKSQLVAKAERLYKDPELRKKAIQLGEKIGEFASEEELKDEEYVNDLADLVLTMAPHALLVDTFKEIGAMAIEGRVNVSDLLKLFERTKIAQFASYGQIVAEKLKTIDVLEKTINQKDTLERDLQKILQDAPWLINPRWELVTANRALKTFREAFEAWYETTFREKITTAVIKNETKQPDFVFIHRDNALIIVEIKPPDVTFGDKEWGRMEKYYDAIEQFLKENPTHAAAFPEGHKIILVCDSEKVSSTVDKAMGLLKREGRMKTYTWHELLKNTKDDHESFLVARDSFEEVDLSEAVAGITSDDDQED